MAKRKKKWWYIYALQIKINQKIFIAKKKHRHNKKKGILNGYILYFYMAIKHPICFGSNQKEIGLYIIQNPAVKEKKKRHVYKSYHIEKHRAKYTI